MWLYDVGIACVCVWGEKENIECNGYKFLFLNSEMMKLWYNYLLPYFMIFVLIWAYKTGEEGDIDWKMNE